MRLGSVRTGRGRAIATAVAGMLLLAACGGRSNASPGSGGAKGGAAAIGSRKISGIGTVLASSSGFTLYHLTTEKNGRIECTGGCRSTWPPLLATSGAPSGPAGVSGSFATLKRPDGGTQVTFDGMPLYRYSGDTAAGQANGQGIGGVWFAVTTSATTGASPSPSGSSGGYGY